MNDDTNLGAVVPYSGLPGAGDQSKAVEVVTGRSVVAVEEPVTLGLLHTDGPWVAGTPSGVIEADHQGGVDGAPIHAADMTCDPYQPPLTASLPTLR